MATEPDYLVADRDDVADIMRFIDDEPESTWQEKDYADDDAFFSILF